MAGSWDAKTPLGLGRGRLEYSLTVLPLILVNSVRGFVGRVREVHPEGRVGPREAHTTDGLSKLSQESKISTLDVKKSSGGNEGRGSCGGEGRRVGSALIGGRTTLVGGGRLLGANSPPDISSFSFLVISNPLLQIILKHQVYTVIHKSITARQASFPNSLFMSHQ